MENTVDMDSPDNLEPKSLIIFAFSIIWEFFIYQPAMLGANLKALPIAWEVISTIGGAFVHAVPLWLGFIAYINNKEKVDRFFKRKKR